VDTPENSISDEAPTTKKVTVYFLGTIQIEASTVDHDGKPRSDEEIVRDVVEDVRCEIQEHLMYSDDDREPGDLVQAIHHLDVNDVSAAVREAASLRRDFVAATAPLRDAEGDIRPRCLPLYDALLDTSEARAWELLDVLGNVEETA
jgi:hypothetical protein